MSEHAVLQERIAQLSAHRACTNEEHDPLHGKLSGYCIVCGIPWPCEVAKPLPLQQEAEGGVFRLDGYHPLTTNVIAECPHCHAHATLPITRDEWVNGKPVIQQEADKDGERPAWVSTDDELPKPGRKVIAFFKNVYGHGRRIRAMHYPKFTKEDTNDFEGDSDYDEKTDTTYWPEGWYETNENDETAWRVSDDVTHWIPLPEPPALPSDEKGK